MYETGGRGGSTIRNHEKDIKSNCMRRTLTLEIIQCVVLHRSTHKHRLYLQIEDTSR